MITVLGRTPWCYRILEILERTTSFESSYEDVTKIITKQYILQKILNVRGRLLRKNRVDSVREFQRSSPPASALMRSPTLNSYKISHTNTLTNKNNTGINNLFSVVNLKALSRRPWS